MSSSTSLMYARQRPASLASVPIRVLQRKYACGSHTASDGECEECSRNKGVVQRKLTVGSSNDPSEHEADRIADQVTGAWSPVRPMGPPRIWRTTGTPRLQEEMGQRFGYDFSEVRIHTDVAAQQSVRALSAEAYTVGSDIAFADGRFAPDARAGRWLLAHELTHVVQQGGPSTEPQASRRVARAPSTAPSIGTKYIDPPGAKTTLKHVNAEFDGQDFVVKDGATTLLTHAAESGRPVSVRAGDAKACGGSTAESYSNNPLYVGIQDFGAIPEGDFTCSLAEFATFSALEQARMITGGMFTDPFGTALHGGDWGSGRAPLHPRKVLPGKSGCGDTSRRSGFFLHGGSLPGSSGCIDIDNSGISALLSVLAGYKAVIPVKVHYTHAAPAVGAPTRALGRFTYPTKDGKPIRDPSISDRFKSLLDPDDVAERPRKDSGARPSPPPPPKQQTKPPAKPESGKKPARPGRGGKKHSGLTPDRSTWLAGAASEGGAYSAFGVDQDDEPAEAIG